MSESVALVPQSSAIVARSFEEARSMSEYIAKAALVPAAIAKGGAPNVCAIIMAGGELGLAPMAALRAFHVIEGVPRLTADALVGVCLSRPDVCEYFYPVEQTDQRSTWATKRRGAPSEVRRSWDMARATTAGLVSKTTWKQHGPRMLAARAKAELARDVYPDLVSGLYTPDEDDIAPAAPAVEVFVRPVSDAEVKERELLREQAGARIAKMEAEKKEKASGPKHKTTRAADIAPPAPVAEPEPPPAAPVDDGGVVDAEIVEPGFELVPSAPVEPEQLAAFRRDLKAARTPEDMKEVRARHVPWCSTDAGRPYGEAMKQEFLARNEALKAGGS